MRFGKALLGVALLSMLAAPPAHALYEGLQCVPYARQVSGVQIYGDAHTWWRQADGRYARGNAPRIGAVLSFIPSGSMRLGHVAAVSRIVNSRTILVRHANWSTIGGVRGHIEDDVRVVDVSADNDWSSVRVWYAPLGDLGTTHWPTHGFIYPAGSKPDRGYDRAPERGYVMARAEAPKAREPRRALFGRSTLASLDDAARGEARFERAALKQEREAVRRPAIQERQAAPQKRPGRMDAPKLDYVGYAMSSDVTARPRDRWASASGGRVSVGR